MYLIRIQTDPLRLQVRGRVDIHIQFFNWRSKSNLSIRAKINYIFMCYVSFIESYTFKIICVFQVEESFHAKLYFT